MFSSCDILRLYSMVLKNDILQYQVPEEAIRLGIRSMTEVYRPVTGQISAERSTVADFNDVAHRCAYLHKYAALHTTMVRDILFAAIRSNYDFFRDMVYSQENLKICSLGGGPGSDVIGVLASLFSTFRYVETSVAVIDYMVNWSYSFGSIIQELSSGHYGSFGDMTCRMLQWRYIGANLLKPLTPNVEEEISEASLITMIKFVSAASCKDSKFMIKNIFTAMKPGAAILFIDNDGGGFRELVSNAAYKYNFIPIFGPIKHEDYINEVVKVNRFGSTSCFKTTVSIYLLQKPFEKLPQLQVTVPQYGYSRRVLLDSSFRCNPHDRYLNNFFPSPMPTTPLTPYVYNFNQPDNGLSPYSPTQAPFTPNTTPRPRRSRAKNNGCLPLSRLRHHISKKFDKFKFSSLKKFGKKLKDVSKK